MKIAYFIMLHHKMPQFRWLFDAVYSENDVYCLHVDRKSGAEFDKQVRRYVGARSNVTYLRPRSVAWGGWSLVAAELEAIGHMLKDDSDWKYFVNLSGQDYPIKPAALIKQQMQREWPRNFIRVWPFSKVQMLEPNDPHLTRRLGIEARGRLVQTRLRLPFPRDLDIKFKGSQWHMLTREFCKWLVTDALTRRVARHFRYTVVPDEVFFQAVIMNSPFKDARTEDYSPYVIWPGPKTLKIEDYEDISRSNSLFARKFDEAVDCEILKRLAGDCGYNPPHDCRSFVEHAAGRSSDNCAKNVSRAAAAPRDGEDYTSPPRQGGLARFLQVRAGLGSIGRCLRVPSGSPRN